MAFDPKGTSCDENEWFLSVLKFEEKGELCYRR
jgi:hypothetical protein